VAGEDRWWTLFAVGGDTSTAVEVVTAVRGRGATRCWNIPIYKNKCEPFKKKIKNGGTIKKSVKQNQSKGNQLSFKQDTGY
jgi:hypothetical protein